MSKSECDADPLKRMRKNIPLNNHQYHIIFIMFTVNEKIMEKYNGKYN